MPELESPNNSLDDATSNLEKVTTTISQIINSILTLTQLELSYEHISLFATRPMKITNEFMGVNEIFVMFLILTSVSVSLVGNGLGVISKYKERLIWIPLVFSVFFIVKQITGGGEFAVTTTQKKGAVVDVSLQDFAMDTYMFKVNLVGCDFSSLV